MDRELRPTGVFVHCHGREARAFDANPEETLADVLGRAQVLLDGMHVFVGESVSALTDTSDADDREDTMEPVQAHSKVREFASGGHIHVHCHRCRRIAVTVNYQSGSKKHRFSPATRVETILAWAKKRFHLTDADADKLLLQMCGTNSRPRPTQHLGEIVADGTCAACFDLVFDQKVEGGR